MKSYADIVQELRTLPSIQLMSKGAFADRLYTEQHTIETSKTPIPPDPTTFASFRDSIPSEFRPGAYHPKSAYLMAVDANRTGGDDNHDNWQVVYRVDVKKLAADFPDEATFPDILANDDVTDTLAETPTTGNAVDWKFTLLNPDGYTRPALFTTEHPTRTGLFLVSETSVQTGPVALIIRRYEVLTTVALTGVNYKKNDIIPDKFCDTTTTTTVKAVAPTATPVDTSSGVTESDVGPLDSARRMKAVVTVEQSDPKPLDGVSVDLETGLSFPTRQEIVAAGADGSDVNAAGIFAEVQPLNTFWSLKTTSKASTLLTARTWEDGEEYTWHPVLASIAVTPITRGGFVVQNLVLPVYSKYRYSGICRAVHEERWTKDAPTAPELTTIQPTPVQFDGIFLNVNIPPCLHQAWNFSETSGTNNPAYDYFIYNASVAATNFTTWPASVIARYNVIPSRGGYLMRKTTIYAPN